MKVVHLVGVDTRDNLVDAGVWCSRKFWGEAGKVDFLPDDAEVTCLQCLSIEENNRPVLATSPTPDWYRKRRGMYK